MKPTMLSLLGIGVVAVGLTAFAQNTSQPNPQVQAPGPGSAPHAWCDRNGDGICDFTGMPVGQGRGQMMSPGMRGQQGWGMGRGMGGGMGRGMRGMGRGMSCPYGQSAQLTTPPAQPGPSPTR